MNKNYTSYSKDFKPYISASKNFPELTFKAIFLGALLSIVMAASNAYLGLKVGATISACIPAAVISMTILRFFRQSNVLENNIVQTTASAGEVVAASVVFTLPALIMMGYWTHFSFEMTVCVVTIGGLLGVMLSVPLRRAFIVESDFPFPEGVATAEVIKAGDQKSKGSASIKELIVGGIWAACLQFSQSGLQIISEGCHCWFFKGATVFGFGGGCSAAVMGSGYIVGLPACISVVIGGGIAWGVGIPLYGFLYGLPDAPHAHAAAMTLWGTKIRYIGVGAMVVGGIGTLFELLKPIYHAIMSSFHAFKRAQQEGTQQASRTEQDIPFPYVLWGIVGLTLPLLGVLYLLINPHSIEIPVFFQCCVVLFLGLIVLVLALLCASISGYMAGILGSSQNPLSGVTILAILIVSCVLLFCLDPYLQFISHPEEALKAAGAVILIGCVVACAAAVSGDNLQDLKSGYLLGSTPWKQQVALIIGVLAGALALAPIIELLFQAYGIGDIMPRSGMDPAQVLSAPKATLMATLSQSIFSRSLDGTLFFLGAGIAVVCMTVDSFLKKRNTPWRLPVLGVAVGIYLPLEVTVPLLFGGLISFWVERSLKKKPPAFQQEAQQRGTLLAAGLITGESLMGIALAVPFSLYQSTDVFRISFPFGEDFSGPLALFATAGIGFLIYHYGTHLRERKS